MKIVCIYMFFMQKYIIFIVFLYVTTHTSHSLRQQHVRLPHFRAAAQRAQNRQHTAQPQHADRHQHAEDARVLQSQHEHDRQQEDHRDAQHVGPRLVVGRIAAQQIDARHAAGHGVHARAERARERRTGGEQRQNVHPQGDELAEEVEAMRHAHVRQLDVSERLVADGCGK